MNFKKIIAKLADSYLSDIPRYRKWIGGKWYKVADVDSGGGMQTQLTFWTRNPAEMPILRHEVYS